MVKHPLDEVLFEFYKVGSFVRVTAIDPITAVEVVYIGSSRTAQEILKINARRKLFHVLNGQPEEKKTAQRDENDSKNKPRHHMNLPDSAQDINVPQMAGTNLDHAEAHAWLQARGIKPIRPLRNQVFSPYTSSRKPTSK